MKTDLFRSCGHCWVFQICWLTECSPLTASSFRILNSLVGILLPPLALPVVMLPKTHLTPGCPALDEWPHHRGYPSHWDFSGTVLLCILLCHLFLISSVSVKSLSFLSFTMPILAWNLDISNFLEEISSLPHSIFSPLFLCIVHLRRPSYLMPQFYIDTFLVLLELANENTGHSVKFELQINNE